MCQGRALNCVWVDFKGGSLDGRRLPADKTPLPGTCVKIPQTGEVYCWDPMQDAWILRWDGEE